MLSLEEEKMWVVGEMYVGSARCSYGTLYVHVFEGEQMFSPSLEVGSNSDSKCERGSASHLTDHRCLTDPKATHVLDLIAIHVMHTV